MRLYLPIFLALGLLAFVACGDSDDSPAATDTPAQEANATAVIEPTEAPPSTANATATPPGPTATARPDVEGPCPIGDAALCNVAESLERAMSFGQLGSIVANTKFRSTTCTGNERLGACGGLPEGTELSGYLVGNDASDYIFYVSDGEYVSLLDTIANTADPAASDEYGDGAWRLVAIIDDAPEKKVLVTTSIGADPVNEIDEPSRRVFLFWLERSDGQWQITLLLSSLLLESRLTGASAGETVIEGWLPWGEE
ncbi:MAG: hypothetical protein IH865_10485 [Chloroflexi bacterium]|nr:hypothetical protein [Chloroflexota bacterium]